MQEDNEQELLDEADLAESMEAVRRGFEDAEAGRVLTLQEFAAAMQKEFGFPEKRPERAAQLLQLAADYRLPTL